MSSIVLHGFAGVWFLIYFIRSLFSKSVADYLFIETVIIGFPFMHITVMDFPLIVYITFLFILFGSKRNNQIIKGNAISALLLSLLIIILAGWYFSEIKWNIQNLKELIQWASVIFFTTKLFSVLQSDSTYYFRFLQLIRIVTFVSVILLLIQLAFGMSLYFSTQMNPNVISDDGTRYPSFFSDPQLYAQFLASICFLMLIPISSKKKDRKWDWLLFSLCIIALMLTGTRSAFLGLSISMLLLFFSSPRFIKNIVFFITPFLVFIFIKFGDKITLFNRGTDMNDALLFRQSVWKNASEIFIQHPLLGIGFGNYANYVERYYPDQHWIRNGEWVVFDHPESGYLKLLTETGLMGSFCLAALFISIIYSAVRKSYTHKNKDHILYLASLIAWLVAFYTVYSFSDIRMLLIIGCIIALFKFQSSKPNEVNF